MTSDRSTQDDRAPAYHALALQLHCRSVNGCDTREAAQVLIDDALDRTARAVAGALRFLGTDTRLVVLPEYFLTGHPMGESLEAWTAKAAIDPEGPEHEALARIAGEHNVFLAGNAYETDPHFPGWYFQTSFVTAPSGEQVLRYRRLISMYSPSPWDVWGPYLDAYGEDAVMPVADTELGRLAAVASEEILYPELARLLALKGAEVFVHSSSEVGSNRPTPKNVAKQARAFENAAYVVSANSAGISGSPVLAGSTDMGSQVVDYQGRVVVEAGYGESVNAFAELDIGALRRHRRRPAMSNTLARQPTQLWARGYTAHDVQRGDELTEGSGVRLPERTHFLRRQAEVIERLSKEGVI